MASRFHPVLYFYVQQITLKLLNHCQRRVEHVFFYLNLNFAPFVFIIIFVITHLLWTNTNHIIFHSMCMALLKTFKFWVSSERFRYAVTWISKGFNKSEWFSYNVSQIWVPFCWPTWHFGWWFNYFPLYQCGYFLQGWIYTPSPSYPNWITSFLKWRKMNIVL